MSEEQICCKMTSEERREKEDAASAAAEEEESYEPHLSMTQPVASRGISQTPAFALQLGRK